MTATFLLVAARILLLCSCRSGEDEYKNIFRYNETTGISTIDPAFAKNQAIMWPVHQLYNTLVEVDYDLNVVPSLAGRWEMLEEGRLIRFYLRTDVFFHDDPVFPGGKGRRLVAGDVVYSFNRIIDPAVASPGAWIFNGRVDEKTPFTAVSDSVFELRLKTPFTPVLGILSMPYCSVVPHEAVSKYGRDFRRHPVGTGPFFLKAWEEGQSMVLRRNPRYFERDGSGNRLPYLDGVFISFHSSKGTEFLEFRQGRLDFINDIDPVFKDEVLTRRGELRKEWKGKIRLNKSPYLNVEYLGIMADTANPLMAGSPFRKKAFRQAVNYAIDRRKLVFHLRNSIGYPAEQGFVPPVLHGEGKAMSGYRYDPEKAVRLLKEIGFQPNAGKDIVLFTVPSYANLGGFIVSELQQVGIPARVEVVQKSLLLEQMSNSQCLFFRGSWIADYPDAENYLSVFYGSNPAPPNYTRFRNKTFDSLYDVSVGITDAAQRGQLNRLMDSIIIEEAPVVPLWYDMVIHLVQNRVEGFVPTRQNGMELRKVRVKS